MKRRVLVSSNEATPAKRQHTSPCGDCPWRRTSLPGWLGGTTAPDWVRIAHGDEPVDCHTKLGAQCAGLAIYRRNVCKVPRNPHILRLEADRVKVFATPTEFNSHHEGWDVMPKKTIRLYAYDGGGLYRPEDVDIDPVTQKPESESYTLYEIADPVVLTPKDLLESDRLLEALVRSKQARRV